MSSSHLSEFAIDLAFPILQLVYKERRAICSFFYEIYPLPAGLQALGNNSIPKEGWRQVRAGRKSQPYLKMFKFKYCYGPVTSADNVWPRTCRNERQIGPSSGPDSTQLFQWFQIYMVHNKENAKPRGYAFIEYEHERDMHCEYAAALCRVCSFSNWIFYVNVFGSEVHSYCADRAAQAPAPAASPQYVVLTLIFTGKTFTY